MGNAQISLPRPASFMPEPVSHCGCALPPGVWGDSGWHFARADPALLYRHEQHAFKAQRPGWSDAELSRAWYEWVEVETRAGRMVNGMHELWKAGLGAVWAVEPCPAYRAVVRRELEATKKKRAAEKRAGRVLGEEEP